MKAKKYTNSSWAEGDYEKEYSTATDTYTTLPATFQTSGADVENYQVFGASSGVGEETENLMKGIIEKANIDTTGIIRGNASSFNMHIAKVVEGREYMITTPITTPLDSDYVYGFFKTFPSIDSQSYDNRRVVIKRSTFTAPIDGYIAFRTISSDTLAMLTEGSTAPASYIPPGYKIPILNTSGVTENLVPEISTANGWRQGYLKDDGTYNPAHSKGEWLSPLVEIGSATSISIAYKPVSSGASQSMYYFDSNGNYISNKGLSTNGYAIFTDFPAGTAQVCYAFRTYCLTEEEIVENEMWTCLVKGDIPPDHYIPHRYESNYDLFLGDSKLYEDEYLDYGEQKIYKTILLTTHDNKDFITSDNNRFCVRRNNNA